VPFLGALKSLSELCSVAQACIGEFGSPDSSGAANCFEVCGSVGGNDSRDGLHRIFGRDTWRIDLTNGSSFHGHARRRQIFEELRFQRVSVACFTISAGISCCLTKSS
jgi:hypothetical protein